MTHTAQRSIVLLSAGRGVRMMPLTKNTPKCLLDIGDGLTVLESQLQSIVEAGGFSRVNIVVGYLAEQVEAKLHRFDKIPVEFIYNPFYDSANNLISLWVVLPYLQEDFVLINGDNIFRPEVLTNLLRDAAGKDIVMVVDHKKKYDEEDMKVVTEGPRVKAVSKKIPLDRANGESIGMISFSKNGREALRTMVSRMVREKAAKEVFYLEALQRLMDSSFPVHYSVCAEDDWKEIDFHPDLEIIRSQVRANARWTKQ